LIYNNLIYLLVVILIFSTQGTPSEPKIAPLYGLAFFLIKGLLYWQLARRTYRRKDIHRAQQYFAAEQRLSILAIVFLAIDVYLLDCRYYLGLLPLTDMLPSLVDIGGIILFFGYLSIMWAEAKNSYEAVFGRHHSLSSFLSTNIKINVAIVIPWLILTIASDLLQLSPFPVVKKILASPWGEPTILLLFFIILAIGFPAIITRLWNCTPMPKGQARTLIEQFCREHRLKYAEIMLWPLFEGQALTAGVMGLTQKFRYLLVTPALLETMTPVEIEAVMAHEIGHVKRYHLQLYLVLFIGFMVLAQFVNYPLNYLLLTSDTFYKITKLTGESPDNVMVTILVVSLLALLVIYFRFVFGYFMRNFERQADLYAFTAMRTSAPLVSVLEKIAWLSGKIRDLPSWHHFGIGQRVDYLEKCERNKSLVTRQHIKVYGSLALYIALIAVAAFSLWKMPSNLLEEKLQARFEASIIQKIQENPQHAVLYLVLAELQYQKHDYAGAIKSSEQALAVAPDDPEVLNHLAWRLLTVKDKSLLNPVRALTLAQKAAQIEPAPHILDTLATAYWANGFVKEAIDIEQKALATGTKYKGLYRRRLEQIRTEKFGETSLDD